MAGVEHSLYPIYCFVQIIVKRLFTYYFWHLRFLINHKCLSSCLNVKFQFFNWYVETRLGEFFKSRTSFTCNFFLFFFFQILKQQKICPKKMVILPVWIPPSSSRLRITWTPATGELMSFRKLPVFLY